MPAAVFWLLWSNKGLSFFASVPQYHDGFAEQVAKWPTNPLDVFIKELQGRAPGAVIGDFGCGMAALAAALPQHRVHSFDLVAANKHVTACDIAHVRAPVRASVTAVSTCR